MASINENIGFNLKKIRKDRGLTLESLSSQSGVSKSMISEIERGIRNPSISILWNLANTLKTPLNFFLKDPVPDTAVIYRAGTLPDITGPGYRYHPLMNFDDTKRIELYSGVFYPSGRTTEQIHYAGVEEYALIASGNLTLHLADSVYTVKTGEILHFTGDKPHWYCNEGTDETHVFVMMYYPDT